MHGNNVNSTTLDNIEHTSPSGLFIFVSQFQFSLEFYKNYYISDFRLENCLRKVGESQLNSPNKLSGY